MPRYTTDQRAPVPGFGGSSGIISTARSELPYRYYFEMTKLNNALINISFAFLLQWNGIGIIESILNIHSAVHY